MCQNRHLHWLWSLEARSPQAECFFCPKTMCTWSSELKWSAWISSLLAMKCAYTPWTAASIQQFHVTPPRPLWLHTSRSFHFPHSIVSESLLFQFMFFRKHLWHLACTQFSKLKFIRHNFVEKWPWNLKEMQGKWCNGELSVLSNLLFNFTHQIFIHHRQSATSQIIMHIFVS